MRPFCTVTDTSTLEELSPSDGTVTIEGIAVGGSNSNKRWTAEALQEAASDLQGASVVAAGTARSRGSLSVFDVGGKVNHATVEDGAVRFEASVKSDLTEAARKQGAEVFVRGRYSTVWKDGKQCVEDAQVGRVLVGNSTDEALSVAARSSSAPTSAEVDTDKSAFGVASLAEVDGELTDDEREVLREQNRLSGKFTR